MSDDDMSHLRCTLCFPPDEVHEDVRAVCGHRLEGIPAPDAPFYCVACEESGLAHVLNHARR